MDMIRELRALFENKPSGRLTPEQVRQVEALLAACWADLIGSDEGGMDGAKLRGRSEAMEWRPPLLVLSIERHGGYVKGSTRAELQHWSIDPAEGTARLTGTGRRQVRPMDAALDIKALAAEVATGVLERREDVRVRWIERDRVQIAPARIIPTTNKQTTTSRRHRFAEELTRLLALNGWRRSAGRALTFERDASPES